MKTRIKIIYSLELVILSLFLLTTIGLITDVALMFFSVSIIGAFVCGQSYSRDTPINIDKTKYHPFKNFPIFIEGILLVLGTGIAGIFLITIFQPNIDYFFSLNL